MDCYDTSACPGDCEGCEYYDEMAGIRRRPELGLALCCLSACIVIGLVMWVVSHFGGGR